MAEIEEVCDPLEDIRTRGARQSGDRSDVAIISAGYNDRKYNRSDRGSDSNDERNVVVTGIGNARC